MDIDTWIFNYANIPHNVDFADAYGEHDLLFLKENG